MIRRIAMRQYENVTEKKLVQIVCNCCGRALRVESGMLREGCFHAKDTFGYFSSNDGSCEEFDLCEECYHKITSEFQLPVTRTEATELL